MGHDHAAAGRKPDDCRGPGDGRAAAARGPLPHPCGCRVQPWPPVVVYSSRGNPVGLPSKSTRHPLPFGSSRVHVHGRPVGGKGRRAALDDVDYHLFAWIEQGHSASRPAERTDASCQVFQAVAGRIFLLRARDYIHFHQNHVSRTEAGDYLLIGPCTLPAEGRAALARDRRLGARPPLRWDHVELPDA